MEQPVVYTPEAYQEIENCFLPVYTLTSGITNNLMIKTMRQALDEEELLTDFFREKFVRAGNCVSIIMRSNRSTFRIRWNV